MINWEGVDKNVKVFSYDGRECDAKIVRVYDGDSINAVFSLTDKEPDRLYKWNCRLIKVDTPEIRTKNLKEKEYGKKVRDFLRTKIMNKVVKLKCYDMDKYGRLLVEIFLDGENINNWLIENKYAKPYDGGKKTKWFVDEE